MEILTLIFLPNNMANLKEAFQYASQNPNSDFAKNLAQLASSGSLNLEAKKYGIDLSSFQPKQEEVQKEQPQQNLLEKVGGVAKDLAVGAGKGVTESVLGLGELALKAGTLTPGISETSKDILKGGAKIAEDIKNTQLKSDNLAQGLGKFAEQVAEFAVPASKVTKATKALPFIPKVAARALTSGAIASVQSGNVGKEAGIAAGVETVLPVAGKALKPVKNIVGRMIKGLASGLSGVGTETIDKIVSNPKVSSQTAKALTTSGNAEVLKKNTETIINGVANIKKEARQAYSAGLEVLQKTDIDEKAFNSSLESVVNKFGVKNMEFSDPKNIKKATDLVTGLFNIKLDGKSLRGYIDDIESSAYKIATSDERLSYNAFIKDLAGSFKDVISKSTPKLDEINKAFSQDMSLAQSIESIFGKVKFKNATELNKIAQKVETVFSQKGLSPEYLDNFLNRIGIKPQDFKASEATRQITNKVTGANTKGLSVGEIMQQITSSVITPKLVRDIAIFTGKSQSVIKGLIDKTAPSMRATFIKSLLEASAPIEE